MITLKKKYISIMGCLAVLILFTVLHYFNLKEYYEEILNNSGLVYEDFDHALKKENERASENDYQYRSITDQEQNEAEYHALVEEQENTTEEAQVSAPENPRLHALSALLLDASNDRVLYEENGFHEMPMASTTKIM
ncbi:MAG: hypothetical protein K0S76_2711, partial [Herbinix sp.]|nr:hypothetical protein [Herbinix sp.]